MTAINAVPRKRKRKGRQDEEQGDTPELEQGLCNMPTMQYYETQSSFLTKEKVIREYTEQLQEEGEEHRNERDSILFIRTKTDELASIINADFGLSRSLKLMVGSSMKRPTPSIASIRSQRENIGKNVIELYYGDALNIGLIGFNYELHNEFMETLDEERHKHVSNFIRGKGQRAAEYGDDWPLRCCDEEELRFQENRLKVIEIMDSKNGLLNEMIAVGCINHEIRQYVERETIDTCKNERLLAIIRRGSLADYNKFISCLLRTNQHHIVSLLAPSLVGDMGPCHLRDDQLSRIDQNYADLVRDIDLKGGMLIGLYSAECITISQMEHLNAATTEEDKNKQVIDIIRKGSESTFRKFIIWLNRTDQSHVSRILVESHSERPVEHHHSESSK